MDVRFSLQNLKKHYRKKVSFFEKVNIPVLNGINLEIFDSGVHALIGESGSGKSTLAKVLVRLETFDSGTISYRNQKLDECDLREFRRHNQIMFQNPYSSVNPCFRIKEIISEPLIIDRRPKSDIAHRIAKMINLLELRQNVLNCYPNELSGGELQRVVLARSLILEPGFIILDEPFSEIDELAAAELLKTFKRIWRDLNIGTLIISHNLNRVGQFADRTSEIKNGRIVSSMS